MLITNTIANHFKTLKTIQIMNSNKYKIGIVFIFISTFFSRADQLQCLDSTTAYEAKKILLNQKSIIYYCACCENDLPKYIRLDSIIIKKGTCNYEIKIIGLNRYDIKTTIYIDLANVFIKKHNKAVNLGIEMDLKCNPCTHPFTWFDCCINNQDKFLHNIFIEVDELYRCSLC